MGGNVIVFNEKTQKHVNAENIDLLKIKRSVLIQGFLSLFRELNKLYTREFNTELWTDFALESKSVFNGSSSYVMDDSIPDSEIIKYKSSIGDIDIMIPEEKGINLWNLLDSLKNKKILNNVEYINSNKPTEKSIGNQINCIFIIEVNENKIPVQVDFELVPFEAGLPTKWSRFSHSSSFDDAKLGIKAVHHKFLIRALVGGASLRNDIIVCTEKSTSESYTISKSKIHQNPRMLKFSVDRGIRVAYEPLVDASGNVFLHDLKPIYRPLSTKESTFITEIPEMFMLTFNQKDWKNSDIEKFWTFHGLIDLMSSYLTDEQILDTTKRYTELLWGFERDRAQELERGDPEKDKAVKNAGYEYYIKKLALPDEREKYLDNYYKDYKV